jgi:Pyridine nucleotide-disulphide oxidoreductase
VALRPSVASDRFELDTEHGMIEAKHVVIATGPFQTPHIPAFGASLPTDIFQVHSRDYRNPRQLPSGAVLVVGSGASGCQIAEELQQAGRKVFLSEGQFHKTPRRYRGRDIYWWFEVHRKVLSRSGPGVSHRRRGRDADGGGAQIELVRASRCNFVPPILGPSRGGSSKASACKRTQRSCDGGIFYGVGLYSASFLAKCIIPLMIF